MRIHFFIRVGEVGGPRVGELDRRPRLRGTLPRVSGAYAFVPQAGGLPDRSPEAGALTPTGR